MIVYSYIQDYFSNVHGYHCRLCGPEHLRTGMRPFQNLPAACMLRRLREFYDKFRKENHSELFRTEDSAVQSHHRLPKNLHALFCVYGHFFSIQEYYHQQRKILRLIYRRLCGVMLFLIFKYGGIFFVAGGA